MEMIVLAANNHLFGGLVRSEKTGQYEWVTVEKDSKGKYDYSWGDWKYAERYRIFEFEDEYEGGKEGRVKIKNSKLKYLGSMPKDELLDIVPLCCDNPIFGLKESRHTIDAEKYSSDFKPVILPVQELKIKEDRRTKHFACYKGIEDYKTLFVDFKLATSWRGGSQKYSIAYAHSQRRFKEERDEINHIQSISRSGNYLEAALLVAYVSEDSFDNHGKRCHGVFISDIISLDKKDWHTLWLNRGIKNRYEGELGKFEYCQDEFSLSSGALFGSEKECLKYIGKETDGENIKIPDGITNCSSMFFACKTLISAPKIPEGVKKCRDMFNGCTALLIAPVIPKGVIDCGYMFFNCKALTKASDIPEGVENGKDMFYRCESLSEIPQIPQTITNGDGMFFGTKIHEEAGRPEWFKEDETYIKKPVANNDGVKYRSFEELMAEMSGAEASGKNTEKPLIRKFRIDRSVDPMERRKVIIEARRSRRKLPAGNENDTKPETETIIKEIKEKNTELLDE